MLGIPKHRVTLSFLPVFLIEYFIAWPASWLHFYSSFFYSTSTGFCSLKWLMKRRWTSVSLVKLTFPVRYLKLLRGPWGNSLSGNSKDSKGHNSWFLSTRYYHYQTCYSPQMHYEARYGVYTSIFFLRYQLSTLMAPNEVFAGHLVSTIHNLLTT